MTDHRDRIEILSHVPLFSYLSAADLERVAGLFEEVAFRKGEVVCREGEPGDTFYVVLEGELEIRAGDETGRILNRLGPRDVLGEMSLLFEGKRTATVTIARSARLLALERTDFNRFFAQNPKVLHYFSKVLSQRLAAQSRDDAGRKGVQVVGVLGPRHLKGKTLVAGSLAELIQRFSGLPALYVGSGKGKKGRKALSVSELHEMPADRLKSHLEVRSSGAARLDLGFADENDEAALVRGCNALVSKLGDSFAYIVLDLGAGRPPLDRAAGEVSDYLVRIVDGAKPAQGGSEDSPTRTFLVLNLFNSASRPIPINHSEPFVLPLDRELLDTEPSQRMAYVLDRKRAPVAPPLHRLARKILGMSVGMAVGGGAAFGIAHVGVLHVFEENGIPVDLLAGTSMGSIIGLGYAAGLTPEEMLDIARRLGTKRTTMSALDFTLTRPGLLAGNRLVSIFSPLLGPVKNFEQLLFPARAVASDIHSGERVWIGRGSLTHAFRCSSSVPMIWAPEPHGERVLVDGAMVDPVPAEVVWEMGADLCIAVNVVPPLKKGVDNVLARAWRQVNRLNPLTYLGPGGNMPNTFDIIMNSIQMLQHELGNFRAISADVRIVPDLSDFTWIEFYRPEELIERGVAAAEAALPEVKRMLEERKPRPA